MKKVFSLKKYVIDAFNNHCDTDHDVLIRALKLGWPQQCDGLTKEECNRIGCIVVDDWMEEME